MKIAFSFFLLIYSRCGAPASWAARHTIVCLDVVKVNIGCQDIEIDQSVPFQISDIQFAIEKVSDFRS